MYLLFIFDDDIGMYDAKEKKFLKTFGKRIAEARKKRGLTQQELAEAISMSVVTVAYLETGKRWATPATLLKLSQKLHINVQDFFRDV